MKHYKSSLELIEDELLLLDLRLDLAIDRFNFSNMTNEQKDLSGVVISEFEIQGILKNSISHLSESLNKNGNIDRNSKMGISDVNGNRTIASFYKRKLLLLEKFEKEIERRKAETRSNNIILPLLRLVDSFSLSSIEYQMLITCLALESDIKYEKLYGYLQDDVNKKKPSIELILRLSFAGFKERIKGLSLLINSRLIQYGIIEFGDDGGRRNIVSRTIQMSIHAVYPLLGLDYSKSKFDNVQINKANIILWPYNQNQLHPNIDSQCIDLVSHTAIKNKLTKYLQLTIFEQSKNKIPLEYPLIQLIGKEGNGKKSLFVSAYKKSATEIPLMIINVRNALDQSLSFEEIIKFVQVQSCISSCMFYLDKFDSIFQSDSEQENIQLIRKIIPKLSSILQRCIVCVSTESKPVNDSLYQYLRLGVQNFVKMKIPDLEPQERKNIWIHYMQKHNLCLRENSNLESEIISEISAKFRLTISQIKNVIKNVARESLFEINDHGIRKVSHEVLHKLCYLESNKNLELHSIRMNQTYTLDDLIISEDRKKQLKDIINYFRNKEVIFDRWGFKSKMGLSGGLNILFTGESGTGKTMSAQILANELNMEIYKIDLSLLVSKYIGETEKNIHRIFQEASESNSLIFFDEADAIFGKRTEIKDSHDRYSNIEINYLLQKLEEHNEIVILASNLKHNIDEAFIRRMNFIIDFPFPNDQERLRIWQNIFPKPLYYLDENSVDLEFLSRQFKTTGSMIRNIALASAFLAASENTQIQMKHLIIATKRELEKKGKPIIKSEFGKFFHLIE